MTDREMVELAAKAAGIEIVWGKWLSREWLAKTNTGDLIPWDPITDDGDALRLAVMLRLTVKIEDHEIEVFNWEGCLVSAEMFNGFDYEATTRHVIVRAAAEIGKQMP